MFTENILNGKLHFLCSDVVPAKGKPSVKILPEPGQQKIYSSLLVQIIIPSLNRSYLARNAYNIP